VQRHERVGRLAGECRQGQLWQASHAITRG
jgi:hypothetical protein